MIHIFSAMIYRAVGDMKAQMVNKKSFDDWPMDKAARFTLNVWDNDAFVDRQGNAKVQKKPIVSTN